MTARETFVARFSEGDAQAVEKAASTHLAMDTFGAHAHDDRGSDEFRYLFLVAIGFDCVTRYREEHGIAATEEDLPDYLALLAGAYEGWVVMPSDIDAVPAQKE